MENGSATISTAMIKILIAYIQKFNIDVCRMLTAEGIDPKILADGNARVPVSVFDRVWRKMISLCEDPLSGLNYGRELARHFPAGSVLFTMMLNCRDIGTALQVFVKYHRTMADMIQPVIAQQQDLISLSWQAGVPDFQASPQLVQALLSIFHTIIRILSQGHVKPVKICIAFPRPDETNEYQAFFKTQIVFNAPKNELLLRPRDLKREIQLANPELFEILERHAERIVQKLSTNHEWSDVVLKEITGLLNSGADINIRIVASTLAVSTRSLQEKLKAENTSFRNLLKAVRKQIAQELLQSPQIPLCDVAFQLGYADQSAFNRAFKRWTGLSPNAFRQQKQTLAPV